MLSLSIRSPIKLTLGSLGVRYLYGVRHDPGVFYVNLPSVKNGESSYCNKNHQTVIIFLIVLYPPDDRAVLLYKKTGSVLDMYSVKVPKKHEGRGLGRLLAEVFKTLYLSITSRHSFRRNA